MFHLLLAIIYLSFISLGLPDGLLGAAWPSMFPQFDVPVSYAGMVSIIICAGTIVSSLQSDRLTKKFGAGKVTCFSVFLTAIALLGFSFSTSYWTLLLWAVPYGLGAGGVDAALNNYVALHYESKHMSWLHCMWGVGASIGPYIISFALTGGHNWNAGYHYVFCIQIVLTIIIMLSLPLWKRQSRINPDSINTDNDRGLSLREILHIPGTKPIMIMFFCYCALEQTAALWASSYLVLKHGVDIETAASFGSMFFIGISIGRGISGFITMKLNDNRMIQLGQSIVLIGILLMFLPFGYPVSIAGLITIGLGCAPIYPCVIHSTPDNFGADKSQAIIGVQMASAYVGSLAMPALFGLIANHIAVDLLPVYLLLILVLMYVMYIRLLKAVKKELRTNVLTPKS